MVIVEQLVEWRLAGKTEEFGENLLRYHFIHHKSHMTWHGLEPGPPRWEASEWPPPHKLSMEPRCQWVHYRSNYCKYRCSEDHKNDIYEWKDIKMLSLRNHHKQQSRFRNLQLRTFFSGTLVQYIRIYHTCLRTCHAVAITNPFNTVTYCTASPKSPVSTTMVNFSSSKIYVTEMYICFIPREEDL
jgi:hypothetical protein